MLDINHMLQSKWSFFSLPPMPKDTAPAWPDPSTFYSDLLANGLFQQLCIIGLIIFYLLDILGCYIYDKYVPKAEKNRLQREQFAGTFISMFHSLMIAVSATLVVFFYLPMDVLKADSNEIIILQYRYCATFSGSYFLLDTLFISYYYNWSTAKKVVFVLHHFSSGICVITPIVCHPIISYISALAFLVEWSTVILNIRIFARLWSRKYLYFVSGWAVIITYPLLRILWYSYMILIACTSEYLSNYSAAGASFVLGGAEIFVMLLSVYYYFAVMMANPQNMYILKRKSEPKKDC